MKAENSRKRVESARFVAAADVVVVAVVIDWQLSLIE